MDRPGAVRLLLQFLRAQESGDPYSFRFEPQDYILPTQGGDSPSARFDWTHEVLADLQAVRLPGRDPAVVQRVGERLRRFIKDAGWAQSEQHIAEAIDARRPIFLTIRSSAAEIYALPWELLALKSGQFIGELDGLLVRYEWPETKSTHEEPSPRPEGGRIFVAWSAAAGAVPASEHVQAIAAACAAGFHPFNPANDVLGHATLDRIARTLEEARQTGPPIAVLHLLCHGAADGSTFGLCLDGEHGPVVVDAMQLRQALAPFSAMVRLVVLSACDSGNTGALGSQLGSVAQALHRCGFAAVIASRFPLSVAGSITLTEGFYGELLRGPASIETALLAARKRLARNEAGLSRERRQLDWASVQLYARHDDGDDTRPIVVRPFRGLLAFQPEHRRFFFGRDAEVREILAELQALSDCGRARFFFVAGASGTGKSSLVLAGAVPKLLEQNAQLALLRMRPGADPNRALDDALAHQPAGAQAILVIDQFDEIFTQTDAPAVREAFVHRLWSLASAPDSGLRIIVTLRVDFIGRCGELTVNATGLRLDRIAYDQDYRVFVSQLQPEQLRVSIVEPARKVGLELQAGLVDRMILEVGHEPGALPLLQDALDVLWQRRDGRGLTQAAYDELGGVIGALQKRADAILDKLPKESLATVQRLLTNLVAVAEDTALDTRLRVSIADLKASVAADCEPILKELIAARLLVQDGDEESSQASRVEVAHEALIRKWPRLRAWIDEDRAGLLVQRRVKQAAQQWLEHRDDSLLYRGGQLAQTSEWRKSWGARLGDLERRFLDESEALRQRQEQAEAERQRREKEAEERIAEERRQKEQQKLEAAQTLARRTRAAAVGLGVLLIGVLLVGTVAYRKSIEATRNALRAKEQWERASQNAAEAKENAQQAQRNAAEAKENAELAQRNASAARDGFLVAVAQTNRRDPTLAAMILREVKNLDTSLWTQAASDALQGGIAETVLRGHGSAVQSVAYSPDGKKIITGSWDDTARIWNADGSGEPLVLKGHAEDVNSVAWSRDGKLMATGSLDKTARIWRANGTGPLVVLKGHSASVQSVAFSPDGTRLISGSRDHTARIWNVDGTGEPIVLQGHELDVLAVAFSPDGKKVATGAMDKTARLFNADGTGDPVVLKGHELPITSIAWSPSGKQVITGSEDKTARVFNANGSGVPIVLQGHRAAVLSVAVSPDGKTVVTGSTDKTARIFNIDGSGVAMVLRQHDSFIDSVAFRPDGKRIVTGSEDHTARIWNVDGTGAQSLLRDHPSVITSLALSADGKRLVVGSRDFTPIIIPVNGAGVLKEFQGHQDLVHGVAFSRDGKRIVTASGDATARIWNADGSGVPIVLKGHGAPLRAVAMSAEGTRIATGAEDKTVRIWSADGSGAPLVLVGHEGTVRSLAFSPDGDRLISGSNDNSARIWSVEGAGQLLGVLPHPEPVSAVAWSPDGSMLATGCNDNVARIFTDDGAAAIMLLGHDNDIRAVAFSPDSRKLATGSADHSVRVFNTDGTGSPLVLKVHSDAVDAVAFSPDGTKLVTGSADKTVRSFVVGPGVLLRALWGATSDCVPVERRRELLLESFDEATKSFERCRQEVARMRGGPGRR